MSVLMRSWNSFASLASSEISPDQEQELYQADERRLFDQLQGCLCCCTSCCEEDDAPYSSAFRSDLLRGRAYWTGDLSADYGFHVANDHPLLSCFLAHPAHPYSKLERFAVLVLVSFLTFPPTFAILRWSKQLQAKQAKETGVVGEVLAMEQLFTRLGAQLEILLLVTVPSLVIQLILESLAILDFQLQEGTGLGKYVACRPLCECAARCIVTIKQSCLVFSFGLACLIYYLSASTLGRKTSMVDAIGPFLVSRAQSWTLWFVYDGLTPCCGFLARWCYEGRPPCCTSYDRPKRPPHSSPIRADAPLHRRRDGLRKELSSALEALAKKREEAALLQWRIHHLEAELLELEGMDAGIPDAMGPGIPVPWGTASYDKFDPKDMVGELPRPSGWQSA